MSEIRKILIALRHQTASTIDLNKAEKELNELEALAHEGEGDENGEPDTFDCTHPQRCGFCRARESIRIKACST